MGISGLLPLLKSIQKPCDLSKFEGKTLGVDAYGWLHRGTVACAMELALGKPTKKYVDFAMHRVRMLKHFKVIPYIIFDGDYLPSKAVTEKDRAKRREESRKAGLELLKAGKTSSAYQEFQKAVDVTPEMARMLIEELKKADVQYIVAPYEADPQMVYLERIGVIDGILSEDSDLLVFGAKCLLTKLDQYGNCIEINRADFCACREVSLAGWTDKEFRRMAILSGCDYLPSINNMGLKTAYRMVRKHKTIEKILRMLQFDSKWHVPKDYLEAFYQAELTFLHQRVFCPKAGSLVLHTEPEHPIDEEKMPYIGAFVEPEIAQGVARGDLNPMTKERIVIEARPKLIESPISRRSSLPNMQKLSTPIDVNKRRSIDTFFRPKRTPLAELDPNSFILSPSQQQAIQRNPDSWTTTPVPQSRLRHSISDVEQSLPHSESPSVRPAGRTVRVASASISEPRPQKRARLCAEDEETEPISGQKVELGQSRFFTPKAQNPSPALDRKNRRKSGKHDDIQIFSDDSIEEALLSLNDSDFTEDVQGSKIAIGSIEKLEADEKGQPQSSTPLLESLDNSTLSQCSTPGLTPSTSSISFVDEAITPSASPDVEVALPKLKRDTVLNSGDSFVTKFRFNGQGLVTPSTISSKSKIPLPVKPNVTLSSSAPCPKPGISPLQRLGSISLSHSKFLSTPPFTPASIAPKSRPSLLGKCSLPFPDVMKKAKKVPIEPALLPLPPPDETENLSLAAGEGSEDLIIPDSEEEDESSSPPTFLGDTSNQLLDLGKFLYAG
ncbi:exonuclease-like protein [Xylogone sp. PMI_703]|nr:exonuclease-like protein [Xylogone sp. PMI_703]